MPLLPGKQNVGRNIAMEQSGGKPHSQAIAIALANLRRSSQQPQQGSPNARSSS